MIAFFSPFLSFHNDFSASQFPFLSFFLSFFCLFSFFFFNFRLYFCVQIEVTQIFFSLSKYIFVFSILQDFFGFSISDFSLFSQFRPPLHSFTKNCLIFLILFLLFNSFLVCEDDLFFRVLTSHTIFFFLIFLFFNTRLLLKWVWLLVIFFIRQLPFSIILLVFFS